MGQMATSISKLESRGKLPSQTEDNPRQNVNAIMLRSGKKLQDAKSEEGKPKEQEQVVSEEPPMHSLTKPNGQAKTSPMHKADQQVSFKIPPPFPKRFERTQKEKEEKEILETFKKVKINIPLLDAVN